MQYITCHSETNYGIHRITLTRSCKSQNNIVKFQEKFLMSLVIFQKMDSFLELEVVPPSLEIKNAKFPDSHSLSFLPLQLRV